MFFVIFLLKVCVEWMTAFGFLTSNPHTLSWGWNGFKSLCKIESECKKATPSQTWLPLRKYGQGGIHLSQFHQVMHTGSQCMQWHCGGIAVTVVVVVVVVVVVAAAAAAVVVVVVVVVLLLYSCCCCCNKNTSFPATNAIAHHLEEAGSENT